jgi:hypothetical protein
MLECQNHLQTVTFQRYNANVGTGWVEIPNTVTIQTRST